MPEDAASALSQRGAAVLLYLLTRVNTRELHAAPVIGQLQWGAAQPHGIQQNHHESDIFNLVGQSRQQECLVLMEVLNV